jgi:GH18 family chitinase
MAATSATRSTFIQSVIAWLNQFSADGVDLDCKFGANHPARQNRASQKSKTLTLPPLIP